MIQLFPLLYYFHHLVIDLNRFLLNFRCLFSTINIILILSNLSTIEVSDLEEVVWFEGFSVVGTSFGDSSVVGSSFVTSSVVFSEVFDSEDEDSFDVVASFVDRYQLY